ncbi:type IV secretory system conjugative DNA transfer family protein [Conexibacter stalactiti]|uniref:Type IV secretory system conjugative DNA transfer family protein n=1 Tax=Conexibacter stalactiti TaxID=1940611 RepID=A0ABU4HTR7_9ACTN|nr:type IV secretory system conjugative DNA transfer family protein [Conexibacter stalactiti]MDW5595925.1 type IV secretory system conjugative DNA transfer family protein [Conexibacter stalactiti]MEC5036567.1 type IV secretory system conjugative DNA transfer family protein [Conexibacter stalactiti]
MVSTRWHHLMLAAATALAAVGGYALVAWPLLVWSLLHGEPALIAPADVLAGGLRALAGSTPARAWAAYELPPTAFALFVDALLTLAAGALGFVAWLRVDRWRGQSHAGAPTWSPRRQVTPRAWATPRDWLHLQPRDRSRSSGRRVAFSVLLRRLLREPREPVAGDAWLLGRLRGTEVRSGPEMHLGTFAASRAGKTVRDLISQIRAHDGPLVAMSTKLDVVLHTLQLRRRHGPVWIFAPMSDLEPLELTSCGWTPLTACGTWHGALAMAQWIFDADPTAAPSSESSSGARFYNREAVETLLPALLHAAALDRRPMADVLAWLRGGIDGLDPPRQIVEQHGADRAAAALADVQQQDERARSYLLISAAQLVSAYRLPDVQHHDRHEFDPARLVAEGGTLYLIAPDSQQDLLAPIFGGIVGELLRTCELNAQHAADPRTLPVLKFIVDEAAQLTPLAKLPTYLAVSGGWGVRWMLVYQSLAQLRHRYGADADTILANLHVRKVLGPVLDRTTRDDLVHLLGEQQATHTSYTADRWSPPRSVTRQQQRRNKLDSDDLLRLGEGMAVVVHGRDLPARVHLPLWWEWEGARSAKEAHAQTRRST